MLWAEAVPNLLIALREGLEAGLVITILLAAVAQQGPAGGDTRISTTPVWLGVGAALSLAGSFAASSDIHNGRYVHLHAGGQRHAGRHRGGPDHLDGLLDAPHGSWAVAPDQRATSPGRQRSEPGH